MLWYLFAGTYSTAVNATLANVCQTCDFGLFSVAPASNTSALCLPCIPGIYINGDWFYGVLVDSWIYMTVFLCVVYIIPPFYRCLIFGFILTGTYYQNISGPSCVSCSPGTYSNVLGANSTDTCLPCPGGSFSSVIGAASLTQCQLCDAGMIYFITLVHKPCCQPFL